MNRYFKINGIILALALAGACHARTGFPRDIEGVSAKAVKEVALAAFTRDDFLAREKALNRVHVLFDETGTLVHPPDIEVEYPYIDENDRLIVHQIIEKAHAQYFSVSVEGDLRVPLFRLANVLEKYGVSPRDAARDDAPPPVTHRIASSTWGPFASSRNDKSELAPVVVTVKIHKIDKDEDKSVAGPGLQLFPYRLSHFQATGGVFYSDLSKRTFENRGGIIARDEGMQVAPVFCLVPYVWDSAGVDLYHLPPHGHKRLSPLIGFGFDDLGRDFFLGTAYQLGRGVFLASGAHVLKVQVLLPGQVAGAAPVTGALTEDRWRSDAFVGITFPLDVFGDFLGSTKEQHKARLDK